jgi:soluble P-type ATPase
MISVNIPGKGTFNFKHIVLDFNGTMACDGILIPGVEERLNKLAEQLEVHIMTADTFGLCRSSCGGIRGSIQIMKAEIGAPEKEKFVESLGAESVVAVGNGTNDNQMLKRAALGIVIVGPEGTSVRSLQAADVAVKDINDGLDMLLNPKRLVATLRE